MSPRAQFCAGLWNKTNSKFKRKTKKQRKKREFVDAFGSRLAVLPKFLNKTECDLLIKLGQRADAEGSLATRHARVGTGANSSRGTYLWNATDLALGRADEVLRSIEHRIAALTAIPVHVHERPLVVGAHWLDKDAGEGAAGGKVEGAVEDADPWGLQHEVRTNQAIVVTVKIYLTKTPGGEIRFPFMGSNDKYAANATAASFRDPEQRWKIAAAEEAKEGTDTAAAPATPRAILSKSKRFDDDYLATCLQLPPARSRKYSYTKRKAFVVPAHVGTAVVYYSRLQDGKPDPDAWFSSCPTLGNASTAGWTATKYKTLPLDKDNKWDYSIASSCPEGVCSKRKKP